MKNWLSQNWFRIVSPIVVIFLFLAVSAFFSETKSIYKCTGELAELGGQKHQSILFMKVTKYRWWVNGYSNSKGNINIEFPGKWFEYYKNLEPAGDTLVINGDFSEGKRRWGIFSELSGTLSLTTAVGDFDGLCSKLTK